MSSVTFKHVLKCEQELISEGHFKILLSLTSRIKIKHTDWKMETQFNHLARPVDAGMCVE